MLCKRGRVFSPAPNVISLNLTPIRPGITRYNQTWWCSSALMFIHTINKNCIFLPQIDSWYTVLFLNLTLTTVPI
jgi:hypothetical protein